MMLHVSVQILVFGPDLITWDNSLISLLQSKRPNLLPPGTAMSFTRQATH